MYLMVSAMEIIKQVVCVWWGNRDWRWGQLFHMGWSWKILMIGYN